MLTTPVGDPPSSIWIVHRVNDQWRVSHKVGDCFLRPVETLETKLHRMKFHSGVLVFKRYLAYPFRYL